MKAQSALEYLVAYGWAIVAIVIVSALLWALGVFGGSNQLYAEAPSVQELVLNSTPEFTNCSALPFLESSEPRFVCSQGNGFRVLIDCFKLEDGVYCSSNPLVRVG